MAPLSVNLRALPIRLVRIWKTRTESPQTVSGRSGGASMCSVSAFWSTIGLNSPCIWSSTRAGWNGSDRILSLRASTRERSRMSESRLVRR